MFGVSGLYGFRELGFNWGFSKWGLWAYGLNVYSGLGFRVRRGFGRASLILIVPIAEGVYQETLALNNRVLKGLDSM